MKVDVKDKASSVEGKEEKQVGLFGVVQE